MERELAGSGNDIFGNKGMSKGNVMYGWNKRK